MPHAVSSLVRARPRSVGDSIVVGRSTVLARRVVERGCYRIESPGTDVLTALLSLAYEKQVSADDPIARAVVRAAADLLNGPDRADFHLAHLAEPSAGNAARLPLAERLLKSGTAPVDLDNAIRRDRLSLPKVPTYAARLALCEKGVVLGQGTVIAALALAPEGSMGLLLKGRGERILTLLSVASCRLIDDKVLRKFEATSRALRNGDTALAGIHIAQVDMPPLVHSGLAEALTLSAAELDKGVRPFDLLQELDLPGPVMAWRKGNPNHVPAGCPEGGQFCSAKDGEGDGTSGDYGTNTKLDVIHQTIRGELQDKKAIALVGGANDDRPDGPVKKIKDLFANQYSGASVEYFSHTESDRLQNWLAEQSKQFGSDNIATVGHSYGGDTAATVVADGNKVGTLVTVDPASLFPPDLDDVRNNATTWINVNANPDDSTSAKEHGAGNFLAGIGGAWNNSPAAHATHHYNANFNHADAYRLLLNDEQ